MWCYKKVSTLIVSFSAVWVWFSLFPVSSRPRTWFCLLMHFALSSCTRLTELTRENLSNLHFRSWWCISARTSLFLTTCKRNISIPCEREKKSKLNALWNNTTRKKLECVTYSAGYRRWTIANNFLNLRTDLLIKSTTGKQWINRLFNLTLNLRRFDWQKTDCPIKAAVLVANNDRAYLADSQ